LERVSAAYDVQGPPAHRAFPAIDFLAAPV
jgi:hypothetical protein